MESFSTIVLGLGAAYLFGMGTILKVPNIISALYFKFIPVVLAICLLFLLLWHAGYIVAVGG